MSSIRTPDRILTAHAHALEDRWREHFYDMCELEEAARNRDEIVASVISRLRDPSTYAPGPAFTYYMPKSEFCYRRLVYIPFEDLVIRYACVAAISEILDPTFSERCFANRLAQGNPPSRLTKDFASVSWPEFCTWQKSRADERGKFGFLVRTDIGAFYDSISHDYLLRSVAKQIGVDEKCEALVLLRKLLETPTTICSQKSGDIFSGTQPVRHGLATGNSTEGVLANIYMRDVDDDMDGEHMHEFAYGRYVDDIRIFAPDRDKARSAMLVLQEKLLARGLSLNASKTDIEEGQGIDKLRSKSYEAFGSYGVEDSDYDQFNEDPSEDDPEPLKKVDKPFEDFSWDPVPAEDWKKEGDAKNFCMFLARKEIEDRSPQDVRALVVCLKQWQGCSRHAAWRLVESSVRRRCPEQTRRVAQEAIVEVLSNERPSAYAKYRILQHLVRRRAKPASAPYRYLELLPQPTRSSIGALVPEFLSAKAFELNIIAIYILALSGRSAAQIRGMLVDLGRPIEGPVSDALGRVEKGLHLLVSSPPESSDEQPVFDGGY